MLKQQQQELKVNSHTSQKSAFYLPKAYILISKESCYEIHRRWLGFIYRYVVAPQLHSTSSQFLEFSATQVKNFEKYAQNYGFKETQKAGISSNKEGNLKKVKQSFILSFLLSQLVSLQTRVNLPRSMSVQMKGKEIFACVNNTQSSYSQQSLLQIDNLSFNQLFLGSISAESIISILSAIFLEKQIIIFSQSPSQITLLCESILMLIRPMTWKCLYIPFLPTAMLDTLHAIVPFIIGVHRDKKNEILQTIDPENKVFYDLDADYLIQDGGSLPESLTVHVRDHLKEQAKMMKDMNQEEIQKYLPRAILLTKKLFMFFMISLLDNVSGFVLLSSQSQMQKEYPPQVFDFKSYHKFVSTKSKEFYDDFIFKTMIFRSFVEELQLIMVQEIEHGRDLRELAEDNCKYDRFIIHFLREIRKIKAYQDLRETYSTNNSNNKRNQSTINSNSNSIIHKSISILQSEELLTTLDIEQNVIIHNTLQEHSKKVVIELKEEFLKYLTYCETEKGFSAFYVEGKEEEDFNSAMLFAPILNLDSIENEADKKISRRRDSDQSRFHLLSLATLPQEQESEIVEDVADAFSQAQYHSTSESLRHTDFGQEYFSRCRGLSPKEAAKSSVMLIKQLNKSNTLENNSNNIKQQYFSYTDHSINQSQELETAAQQTFRRTSINNITSIRESKSETGFSHHPQKKKIFENKFINLARNSSTQGFPSQNQSRQPHYLSINPIHHTQKNAAASKKRGTEMSIEERTCYEEEDSAAHIQPPKTPDILEESSFEDEINLGENHQEEEEEDQDSQISEKKKSRRLDIPEETYVNSIVPTFFQGETEMRNIVTLNIDQITSFHSYRLRSSLENSAAMRQSYPISSSVVDFLKSDQNNMNISCQFRLHTNNQLTEQEENIQDDEELFNSQIGGDAKHIAKSFTCQPLIVKAQQQESSRISDNPITLKDYFSYDATTQHKKVSDVIPEKKHIHLIEQTKKTILSSVSERTSPQNTESIAKKRSLLQPAADLKSKFNSTSSSFGNQQKIAVKPLESKTINNNINTAYQLENDKKKFINEKFTTDNSANIKTNKQHYISLSSKVSEGSSTNSGSQVDLDNTNQRRTTNIQLGNQNQSLEVNKQIIDNTIISPSSQRNITTSATSSIQDQALKSTSRSYFGSNLRQLSNSSKTNGWVSSNNLNEKKSKKVSTQFEQQVPSVDQQQRMLNKITSTCQHHMILPQKSTPQINQFIKQERKPLESFAFNSINLNQAKEYPSKQVATTCLKNNDKVPQTKQINSLIKQQNSPSRFISQNLSAKTSPTSISALLKRHSLSQKMF